MAERFVVPQRQLHRVPNELNDLTAVLVEPLSTPCMPSTSLAVT